MTAVAEHELALATEQLGGAVRAVPGDEVVGVAGDHEAVAAHLAEIDWRSEHLERALDEPAGQVQVEEVGVQPGREARGVVVPVQDVERRRVVAHEVVVDPVVPHEVVRSQPGEDPGHVLAGEHARPKRSRPGRLDGGRDIRLLAVVSVVVSSPATRKVTELTRLDSPVAARWPRSAASVTPPAHTPATLASSLPAMSHATWIASWHAAA